MYCNGKCCCKHITKIALRISTLFNLLNQHLQSQDEEKKSGNESAFDLCKSIRQLSILSQIHGFMTQTMSSMQRAMATYAVHEAPKVIRSWTSIRSDSWTFPRLHVPIALDLYENAQNSETASRSGFSPRKWNTVFSNDKFC